MTLFFLFFTAIFAVIPIINVLATVNAKTVFIYVFVFTGIIIKASFRHNYSSLLFN